MTLTIDRRALLLGAMAAATLPACPAFAGEPILEVRGKIAGSGQRTFSLADLEAQPHVSFTTKTPWHAEAVSFQGIGIDALLDLVGATGTKLRLIALNDYVVEAEIADFRDLGGIVAYRENGREMAIIDKGPFFIVFPFDADAKLQHQSVYARCVWQLAVIEII